LRNVDFLPSLENLYTRVLFYYFACRLSSTIYDINVQEVHVETDSTELAICPLRSEIIWIIALRRCHRRYILEWNGESLSRARLN